MDADSSAFKQSKQVALLGAIFLTALLVYLCFVIAQPFVIPIIWAMALAILTFPFYREIRSDVGNPNVAAAIATVLLSVLVILPVTLLVRNGVGELWQNAEFLREGLLTGSWLEGLPEGGYLRTLLEWLERHFDLENAGSLMNQNIRENAANLFSGSLWFIFQFLVTFFALFFFFRDHKEFVSFIRSLMPFTTDETNKLFQRVKDTLYIVVFGDLLFALFQGLLGGVAFWLVGFPAPFFWGLVMSLVGFLPVVGTWMIWLPGAVILMYQGEWLSGIFLLAWGVLPMSVLPAILYPRMIGNRLHLHTLLVFFSLLGGIMAFGAVGIIIGPIILAGTVSLMEIWKERISVTDASIVN